MSLRDHIPDLSKYSFNSGVNCALRPSKSIRYFGDFVIAGFVIAGLVFLYFTVTLPGFQMLIVITTGSSL